VLSGQVIGHFGIVVIVWLNAALLAAAAPMALGVPQLLSTGGYARATSSQARGVGVLLRLPLYRKMVLLAMLIFHCQFYRARDHLLNDLVGVSAHGSTSSKRH